MEGQQKSEIFSYWKQHYLSRLVELSVGTSGFLSDHAIRKPLQLSLQSSCRLPCSHMSLLSPLLPLPSNTPRLLLMRENPEQLLSLCCPLQKSAESHWGLSSETGRLRTGSPEHADVHDSVGSRRKLTSAKEYRGSPGVDTGSDRNLLGQWSRDLLQYQSSTGGSLINSLSL